MIKALEVYDSFRPKKLLEVKFVLQEENRRHYDFPCGEIGMTLTGRTFRSSYYELRKLLRNCALDESKPEEH